MRSRFSARLHALLASRAPYGVVIRRGPSKSACTVGWDRTNDTFRLGQWMRGRIYERRSDLSPDGRYLIYFAMNGKWESETKGSWTAISRAPYLRAIALFAKGDCWNGGGLFVEHRPRTGQPKLGYWLNDRCDPTVLRQTSELARLTGFRPEGAVGGECLSIYYPRLLRDGWARSGSANGAYLRCDVFEKELRNGWKLRKLAHAQVNSPAGKGCYWDEHELVRPDGSAVRFADWEWADRDGERLVYATDGKLCTAMPSGESIAEERILYDFRPMEFEAIEAPYE